MMIQNDRRKGCLGRNKIYVQILFIVHRSFSPTICLSVYLNRCLPIPPGWLAGWLVGRPPDLVISEFLSTKPRDSEADREHSALSAVMLFFFFVHLLEKLIPPPFPAPFPFHHQKTLCILIHTIIIIIACVSACVPNQTRQDQHHQPTPSS